ncbi:non-heme iron oxygenase ferredoxin subunit [Georgenia sp. Z1491]|uniref:non-heme iron oxygenase ferredoxin subunit n=1 Tax=Georgenia sp. Z1491 TaxID=3416707 RepID=UPI003CF43BF7
MTRVASAADLEPGDVTLVTASGEDGRERRIALARDEDGSLHALDDTCSHERISLSDGEVFDGALECWKHGSAFDLRTGRPTSLPATVPVTVYALAIEGDDVLIDPDTHVNAA